MASKVIKVLQALRQAVIVSSHPPRARAHVYN